MKLPAFQFYPADWRKDPGVQALSYHDRGVWFELMCLMHESEKRGILLLAGKPMPEDALARLLGLDKQNLTTTLTNLLTYGVASRDEESGALMCRRMVRDQKTIEIRRNAGKQGGNPVLLKQKSTTGVKQIPTPSSSSSVSSSSSEDNTLREISRAGGEFALTAELPEQQAKATTARKPDPLFEALAQVEGSNSSQLTKRAGRAIAVALAEIRRACPELTPEEIMRRAESYRKLMPRVGLTASALAMHWARCGAVGSGLGTIASEQQQRAKEAGWA